MQTFLVEWTDDSMPVHLQRCAKANGVINNDAPNHGEFFEIHGETIEDAMQTEYATLHADYMQSEDANPNLTLADYFHPAPCCKPATP